MRFLDTNVLVYSLSTAHGEAAKRAVALRVLEEGNCALSVQVLQEFYVQVTRPSRPNALEHGVAVRFMEAWTRYPVADLTLDILRHALAIRARFRFHYWDCAIVATAIASGCETVLTEDLNDGQIVDGVRIVNPFR